MGTWASSPAYNKVRPLYNSQFSSLNSQFVRSFPVPLPLGRAGVGLVRLLWLKPLRQQFLQLPLLHLLDIPFLVGAGAQYLKVGAQNSAIT